MRLFCGLILLVTGVASMAHAESEGEILSLLRQRLRRDVPYVANLPLNPVSTPVAAESSRVSNITDVVIGETSGVTYLGTAIWRDAGYLAWHDGRDEAIWICQLDPETGELIPASGKGTRIGTAAPFVGDYFARRFLGVGQFGTNNGPEWGASQEGLGVYLTIVDENGIFQQASCLVDNFPTINVEQITFGGDKHRFSNLATQNPDDPMARVGYYEAPLDAGTPTSPESTVLPPFWKFDDPGAPQHAIPLDVTSFNGTRWIPNTPSLTTFLIAPDETVQVAEFDTDTEETTFITAGPEEHAEAEVVADPDTGLPRWMTCIEDNLRVAIYEKIGDEWVKQNVVTPVPDPKYADQLATVFAVKPLVIRGELFFFYNVILGDSFAALLNPVDIYLGSADGSVNQRLTNGSTFNFSLNPQWYVGSQDNKVYLYYYTSLPVPYIVHLGKFHRLSFTIDE